MNERWPKVLSILLGLLLTLAAIAYVHQGNEVKTLRSVQETTLQTLHNQTQLIVVLRKELAGLHYRNFESEQALRLWVNNWMLTKMPIVIEFLNANASIEVRGEKYSLYQDCDDFAEAMQRDALRDGYLMSVALVHKSSAFATTYEVKTPNHMVALATTDNAYWYIEPQTGQISRIVRRD